MDARFHSDEEINEMMAKHNITRNQAIDLLSDMKRVAVRRTVKERRKDAQG